MLKLLFSFVGVFFSYLLNGIVIESITKNFGERIFTFYFFMILIPSLFNMVFAKAAILLRKSYSEDDFFTEEIQPGVPQHIYVWCAIYNTASLLSSSASLVHISYPTQLILKSCKPIAILLFGCCLGVKDQMQSQRFLSVTLIVTGVVVFMYEQYVLLSQHNTKVNNKNSTNLIYGWGLVFLSLTMDGLLAAKQTNLREHNVSSHNLMFYVNYYTIILIAVGALVLNKLPSFYNFLQNNQSAVFYLFALGLTSAIGQNFIYYTITEFGPLTCSVITTTRKFFNILVSVVVFSHIITLKLFSGIIIVFAGLALDIWILRMEKVGKSLVNHQKHDTV